MGDRDPQTPRRLPLPSVTSETNGNGEHDRRNEPPPKTVYEAALRSYNAVLEAWERLGVLAREVAEGREETRELRHEVRAIVARLDTIALSTGQAPQPPLPPMRDRYVSEHELVERLPTLITDLEDRKSGAKLRGWRETAAVDLVKGLVGLIFAGIVAAFGVWWGQTHPAAAPVATPALTAPATRTTP